MKDDSGKYMRLFGMLFLSVLVFLVALVLIFLGLRLVFGLVNQLPWTVYIYTLFVLSVPAAIFTTAFIIYFRRTRSHPSLPVRIISYVLFTAFLCMWLVFYVQDINTFFHTAQTQIVEYKSWGMIFLSANVACIFLVGVMQAFSSAEEEDWLDRTKKDNPDY